MSSMAIQTISILGCGWLGLPLAQSLIDEGYTLKGSTTTPQKINTLEEAGIGPYLIELDPDLKCKDCDSFFDTDLLYVNIPPGRRDPDVLERHPKQVAALLDKVQQASIDKMIFIGSTSVYAHGKGKVSETDTDPDADIRDSGKALLRAEQMLQDQPGLATTIVRFGGLYGYDRHPSKYLAGKKNVSKGNAPVNLIHRDDCIAIIKQIIEEDIFGEIFNAVSDEHPTRREFYTAVCEDYGLEPPTFQPDDRHDYKVVSNQKIKKRLNYSFIHPDPRK